MDKQINLSGENLASFLNLRFISEILERSKTEEINSEVLSDILRENKDYTQESMPVLKEIVLSAKDKHITFVFNDSSFMFCFKSIDLKPNEPIIRFENNIYYEIK